MSSEERWNRWVASGAKERELVGRRFRELEFSTRQAAAELASGVEKAGNSLKWGGLALVTSAAILRVTSLRRGFRSAKWLLSLAPVVARLAGSRVFPGLHPFRRRNSK